MYTKGVRGVGYYRDPKPSPGAAAAGQPSTQLAQPGSQAAAASPPEPGGVEDGTGVMQPLSGELRTTT